MWSLWNVDDAVKLVKLIALVEHVFRLTQTNYSTFDPALSSYHLDPSSVLLQHHMTMLPLAGLRGEWVEGHSGRLGEGAMGGYLFNNSKMQIDCIH